MPDLSTIQKARNSPHTHSFVPGVGYLDHGREPRIADGLKEHAKPPVLPPAPAAEGGIHLLMAPQGTTIAMIWKGGLWYHAGAKLGRRMAFKPDYLGRAGWSYNGPAPQQP